MKKFYFLIVGVLFLFTACAQKKAVISDNLLLTNINLNATRPVITAEPNEIKWQTFVDKDKSFTFQYPDNWNANGGGDIECASIYEIGELRLIVFGACWKNYVDGPKLTLQQTYDRFKKAYLPIEPITKLKTNGINMEVIKFTNAGDNGIFTLTQGTTGTIALWQNKTFGYALIDEGNKQQADNIFNTILNSFQFMNK